MDAPVLITMISMILLFFAEHSFVVMWDFPGFFAAAFSLVITTVYTQFGLMISVAYTDIVQLLFMMVGFVSL